MRALDDLSGRWIGLSTQDAVRISEDLDLRLGGGRLAGSGADKDGDFTLEGGYDPDGKVRMTRRYTFCTSGPEGIGIPYVYEGRWDGHSITGRWRPPFLRWMGGPFEMWPAEEGEEYRIGAREEELVGV